jgi:hypothetical protein
MAQPSGLNPKAHDAEPIHNGAPFSSLGGPTPFDWQASIDAAKEVGGKDTSIKGQGQNVEPSHLKGDKTGPGGNGVTSEDATETDDQTKLTAESDDDLDDLDDLDEDDDAGTDGMSEGDEAQDQEDEVSEARVRGRGRRLVTEADLSDDELQKIFNEDDHDSLPNSELKGTVAIDGKKTSAADDGDGMMPGTDQDQQGPGNNEETEPEPSHLDGPNSKADGNGIDEDPDIDFETRAKQIADSVDDEDELDLDEDDSDQADDVAESKILTIGLKNLFESVNLTEEHQKTAKMLFESAVKAKARRTSRKLNEAYKQTYKRRIALAEAKLTEVMTDQVDRYLSTMVAGWMARHKPVLASSMKTDLAESLIAGLTSLLIEHDLRVPAASTKIAQATDRRLALVEHQLQVAAQKNKKLRAIAESLAKKKIAQKIAGKLPVTEQVKFLAVAVEIPYKGSKDYTKKIGTLAESFTGRTRSVKKTNYEAVAGTKEIAAKMVTEEATQGRPNNTVDAVNAILDRFV